MINKTSKVLFENKIKNENKYFGRDEHFNSVIVNNKENLVGEIRSVRITSGNHNTLYGELSPELNQNNHAA